ncbi:hypothetical protein MUK42_11655 [Musa troglodytarum]|uniref:Uncharacterized protein n=1 Tax=Musa troglodytarum TaxID=320322 RepID=A0A9E7KIH4_9LILI|nr:hypothetical protein MUK42_11655 [Musa troglodytarum]
MLFLQDYMRQLLSGGAVSRWKMSKFELLENRSQPCYKQTSRNGFEASLVRHGGACRVPSRAPGLDAGGEDSCFLRVPQRWAVDDELTAGAEREDVFPGVGRHPAGPQCLPAHVLDLELPVGLHRHETVVQPVARPRLPQHYAVPGVAQRQVAVVLQRQLVDAVDDGGSDRSHVVGVEHGVGRGRPSGSRSPGARSAGYPRHRPPRRSVHVEAPVVPEDEGVGPGGRLGAAPPELGWSGARIPVVAEDDELAIELQLEVAVDALVPGAAGPGGGAIVVHHQVAVLLHDQRVLLVPKVLAVRQTLA